MKKNIQVGIKIGNNLNSGKYTNKLIFSVVPNSYEPRTVMAKGYDFNNRIADLDRHQEYYGSYRYKDFAHHIKRSDTAPDESIQTKDISSDDSDNPILAWYSPTDQTVYFYSAEQKIFLNKDCSGMFVRFKNLTDIDFIREFDMTEVTDMSNMFDSMGSMESLDLSNFNTSKVTDMDSMFAYMPGLTNINLSSFNTENVEDMSDMFRDSNNLVTINLSSFNTKKVKDMSYMFSVSNSPQRLKTIYVSDNFVVDNVTNWNYVFAGQVTLRGGSGSYLNNPSLADKSWLRIDDPTNGRPGYFTRKP